MKRLGWRLACMLAVALTAAHGIGATAAPAPIWVRVVNAKGGSICARLGDAGAWVTLGAVTQPATRTAQGFGAGRWAQPGTVAATAVHGIRIRIADGEFGPMMSLVPRQFAAIPDFYGGHVPGDSGVRTNIGAGETLFREFAPVTGSPVYLETGSGQMPLPGDYCPAPGDVLLIRSIWASDAPTSIDIENRRGGAVIARYEDGRSESLGVVSQTLSGIGRFDGTSYTGVGSVNTNHPGVITVSTAPVVATDTSEGAAPERRGGFQISPAQHVRDQAGGFAQVLGVAPLRDGAGLEGRSPLFGRCLALWAGTDADPGFRVEMRVDGGPWQPLPAMVGRDDVAMKAAGLAKYLPAAGRPQTLAKGVTALRMVLPPWSDERAKGWIDAAGERGVKQGAEPTGVYAAVHGIVTLRPNSACRSVTYQVDGDNRAARSSDMLEWEWDTTKEANGRHYVVVRGEEADGTVKQYVRRVLVLNKAG